MMEMKCIISGQIDMFKKIADRKKGNIFLLAFINVAILASCNGNDYIKKAVESDAIICPLICTNNLDTITMWMSSGTLITELSESNHIKNADDFIVKCLKNEIPIQVSNSFFEEYSFLKIEKDSLVDEVYQNDGVHGLLNKYLKEYNELYILWNGEEMFPVRGEEPFPAFGLEYNTGYIIYLFSKHNIYFYFGFMEHIDMISIDTYISDMSALE